jgi:poly-beta-1,6-N-acetyl-D-glucosamine synthase
MATEDIDLTWKLLLNGWQTAYEPRALVGMQVPASGRTLWAQRKRWARGQGEVLHVHLRDVVRWRNHRMWLLGFEALASLIWVVVLVVALLAATIGIIVGKSGALFGFALAWGIAISFVALLQMVVALSLERGYDRTIIRPLLLGAAYPIGYWMLAAAAAVHSEASALARGPREQRVVWNLGRERFEG